MTGGDVLADPRSSTTPASGLQHPGPAQLEPPGDFQVHLSVFDGPFDLLLTLISKHRLDVTEVALAQVTDEFMAYIRGRSPAWDLEQATSFLVVAATLLDLKTARLLPTGEVEDEEDLALLETRDLLFARLLQYRAYRQVAAILSQRWVLESRRYVRSVGLEAKFVGLLPDVVLGLDAAQFAVLAARVLAPRLPPTVSLAHVHVPQVSVRDQALLLIDRLRRLSTASFRALTDDCPDRPTVVARFLAVLELFRDGLVAFTQFDPLGELQVSWTGKEEGSLVVEEYDDAVADSPGRLASGASRDLGPSTGAAHA